MSFCATKKNITLMTFIPPIYDLQERMNTNPPEYGELSLNERVRGSKDREVAGHPLTQGARLTGGPGVDCGDVDRVAHLRIKGQS